MRLFGQAEVLSKAKHEIGKVGQESKPSANHDIAYVLGT